MRISTYNKSAAESRSKWYNANSAKISPNPSFPKRGILLFDREERVRTFMEKTFFKDRRDACTTKVFSQAKEEAHGIWQHPL
jgi:hypothetical protein